MLDLDCTVYEIRKYCCVLNQQYLPEKCPQKETVIKDRWDKINHSSLISPFYNQLDGGYLETVIEDSNHCLRKDLIWKNILFTKKKGKTLLADYIWQNSQFNLGEYDKKIIEELSRYAYIPKPKQ